MSYSNSNIFAKSSPQPDVHPTTKPRKFRTLEKKTLGELPAFFGVQFFMNTLLERVMSRDTLRKNGMFPQKKDPFARTGTTGKLFQWFHIETGKHGFSSSEFLRKCVDIMCVNPESPPQLRRRIPTCEFGFLFSISRYRWSYTPEI